LEVREYRRGLADLEAARLLIGTSLRGHIRIGSWIVLLISSVITVLMFIRAWPRFAGP
jgi:hypothetical protein